ncbi:MAG: DUF2232 domain-containing protein [Clostridiales bacterium]|jgi:uncharacterized protein YybS (DUF2232 family)|nr:DUF2232 domain-containing protein [Clostridiales bacterium]
MNPKLKAVLESALIAAISTVLLIILAFVPILNVVILIWPVPFIVIGVRRGPWAGVLGLVLAGLLLGAVLHPLLGIGMVVLNIFLVLGLSWAIARRLDLFEYIVLSAGTVLISIIGSIKAFSWFMGKTIFEYVTDQFGKFISSNIADFSRIMDLYNQFLDQPVTPERFTNIIIGQLELMVPFVPAMLIIFALIYGTINLMVSRAALRKLTYDVPELPEFSDWMLPKGAGLGFMITLFVAFLGNMFSIKNFEIVFYTLQSLFSFIFMVQGLAVATFFMKFKMSKIPAVVRTIILVLLFLIIPVMFMSLGIIEQIFNIRRIYRRINL